MGYADRRRFHDDPLRIVCSPPGALSSQFPKIALGGLMGRGEYAPATVRDCLGLNVVFEEPPPVPLWKTVPVPFYVSPLCAHSIAPHRSPVPRGPSVPRLSRSDAGATARSSPPHHVTTTTDYSNIRLPNAFRSPMDCVPGFEDQSDSSRGHPGRIW